MKLIKDLRTKRNKNNKMYRWGLFYCEYCQEKIEKPYLDGLRAKSCGCVRYKLSGLTRRIHGCTCTSLYHIWKSMKQRCCNTNSKAYKWYGGRGITICDEWKNDYIAFRTWALNNGYNNNLQIDREDNNSNYTSSNCRWVTNIANMRNSRATKLNLKKVQQIRSLYNNIKISQVLLSKLFNISNKQISSIINNKNWVIDLF